MIRIKRYGVFITVWKGVFLSPVKYAKDANLLINIGHNVNEISKEGIPQGIKLPRSLFYEDED
jgi:hypothetical protein